MSDMHDQEAAMGLGMAAVNRRKLMGGMAALTVASTVAAPAIAAVAGPDVRTLRAAYALRGGMTINGFFAAPKGKADLGVVLVVPATDGATAEELALRYARKGFLAIALDFASTTKAEPYLSVNPMGKAPAIVHKGKAVTECAAICAYLADAVPEAGLAPAITDRADYYRWLFFDAGPAEQEITNQSK